MSVLSRSRYSWLGLACAVASTIAVTTHTVHITSVVRADPAQIPAAAFESFASGLHWRLVGPFRGGRVLAVSGVAGNSTLFYFGAVDGGVWKTDDAGRTWDPIFDDQPVGSIGAIAIAQSNPKIIYVGSGEADMRSDIAYGNGMYKSTDAGATWQRIGLLDSQHIARVVVDPKNTQRVFVAALGHAYGPNAERGVFRSIDGGATWQKVLFTNENTGAVDIAMDPRNNNHLFAALWQTRRPPWTMYPPSNGPGSGLYETTDGGAMWRHLTGHGLPASGLGRMGIAFAPSAPNRIYLIADAKRGGLYRSDNGGQTWHLINADSRLWDRGWYFGGVTVDPKRSNIVYISDTALYRSTNSGVSFTAIKGSPDGDDFHTLWVDPTNPSRLILGCDQGASISLNFGATWSSWYNQPTGQFYHVATDTRFPFWLYGAQQDSESVAALSRSAYSSLTFRDWRALTVGGESEMLAPDPLDTNILFGGRVNRYDLQSSQNQIIDPTMPYPTTQWRETWTLPLVVSQADPHALYFGRQMLFRTRDSGNSWTIISPDLTRPNPGVPANLDAATAADNLRSGPRRGVIYTIAPSPLRQDQIWVGTDDGKIWLTTDAGERWHDVTPPQLTAWSKVTMLEASWFDPQEAYAAIDRHRLDDREPYVYRTRDGGATWQLIASGIPSGSYLNAIREDPQRPGLLYAGTEKGPFISFDDGDTWLALQLNLPSVSIRDFSIRGDSLAMATHGRGFWVLDDLAPLRQLSADVLPRGAWLFSPATVVRVRPGSDQGERLPPDEPAAPNPPDGAVIDYLLGIKPATAMTLEVLDGNGQVVRHWSSSDRPIIQNPNSVPYPPWYIEKIEPPSTQLGLHQFVWDLRYARAVALTGHTNSTPVGPWAPPGRYTVRMSANAQVLQEPLELVKDPRVRASDTDLREQFDLAQSIEHERANTTSAYHTAVAALKQIRTLQTSAKTGCSPSELAAGEQHLSVLAGGAAASSPDNSVGYPQPNLTSLYSLALALETLETAVESADAAPTSDERRAFATLRELVDNDVSRLPHGLCGITGR